MTQHNGIATTTDDGAPVASDDVRAHTRAAAFQRGAKADTLMAQE
jgi:hypothetical protein